MIPYVNNAPTRQAMTQFARISDTTRAEKLQTLTTSIVILQRAYLMAADRALGHLRISQASAWVIVTIGRQGEGIRQGVAASLLGIEGPSLIRTLNQLITAGLVERRGDPADKRAKTLHLTPAGLLIHAEVEAIFDKLRAEVFEGASDCDIDGCLRVFAVLAQRLNNKRSHQIKGNLIQLHPEEFQF